MKTEDLIEGYLKIALGIEGIRAAVVDDTVTLVRDEKYHIFIGPDTFFFVGSFTDDEFGEVEKLRDSAAAIRYIYENED